MSMERLNAALTADVESLRGEGRAKAVVSENSNDAIMPLSGGNS